MCGLAATNWEAFVAGKLQWSKAFIEKLVQLIGRMQLLRAEAPGQDWATSTSLLDSLGSSIKEMVMVNKQMLDAIPVREPEVTVKAAFPKLKLQELKALSGKAKDYPGWRHYWAQRVDPQYEDAAQVSLVKDYLPKNVAEEMVGAHMKTMGDV